VITSLENDVFPVIGHMKPDEITAPTVLGVVRIIERRGAIDTARRVRQRMSSIFVYAIATGRGSADPAATIKEAMTPLIKGRQPAIINLDKAREMMRATETVPAHPVTKLALRLLAIFAVRPGTLATTPWDEWAEFSHNEALWVIPSERMKLKRQQKGREERDHIVPVPRQALDAIEVLRKLTGRGPYAFPNARFAHRHMSENAMNYLLNRAGYHSTHVPHGFRSTFSSVMNERFPQDGKVIDLMLAHTPKDKVEGAYNRALHLPRRIQLAQEWADLIMEGAPPAAELLAGPKRVNVI
jgi:integrase